jgi:UDP-2,3-diacylglucosamine hydrolase
VAERIAFCADVHLTPRDPARTERFIGFLKDLEGKAGTLYMLGDVFDFWIGWRHLRLGEYDGVIAEMRRLANGGTKIFFLPGNRDFLVDRAFAKRSGVKILREFVHVEIGGRKVCLTHGDLLCTSDAGSKRFAAVMRGGFGRAILQPLFRLLPARVSYFLARGFNVHSDRVKKHKDSAAFEFSPAALRDLFARGCDVLVCGHLHRPQRREFRGDGKKGTVFVLGDWEGRATWLEYADGRFELKTFD